MTASHNVAAETQMKYFMYMLHPSFDVDYGIGGGLPIAVVNINRFNVVCWKLSPRVLHLSFCWRNRKLPLHISSITETNTTCIHRHLFHFFFHSTYNNTYYEWYGKNFMKQTPVLAPSLWKYMYMYICKYIENFISCLFFLPFCMIFFPVKYLDICI